MKRKESTPHRRLAASLLLALLAAAAWAEPGDSAALRPAPHRLSVTANSVGVAWANELDSYMAPFGFTGTGLAYQRERIRFVKWAEGWRLQSLFSSRITQQKFSGKSEYGLMMEKEWGLLCPALQLLPRLTLSGGLQILAAAGALYLPANSNNYISARLRAGVAATGMALYKFALRKQTATARLQLSLPLAGCAFSPHYGESYYEIFGIGNYDGTLLFTHPGNSPSMKCHLSADLPWGSNGPTLRIGYTADLYQSRLHGLKTHAYTHTLTVGIVKNLYRIAPGEAKRTPLPY